METLKIIIMGSKRAGKTCFMKRWTEHYFPKKYIKTEIHQSARRIYELEESGKKRSEYKNYRIELIEMVCTKRWEDFNKIFVKDVQGMIFLVDPRDSDSREK